MRAYPCLRHCQLALLGHFRPVLQRAEDEGTERRVGVAKDDPGFRRTTVSERLVTTHYCHSITCPPFRGQGPTPVGPVVFAAEKFISTSMPTRASAGGAKVQ